MASESYDRAIVTVGEYKVDVDSDSITASYKDLSDRTTYKAGILGLPSVAALLGYALDPMGDLTQALPVQDIAFKLRQPEYSARLVQILEQDRTQGHAQGRVWRGS